MRACSMPRHSDRPVRTICGCCVELYTSSCSSRWSQVVTTPRPSRGLIDWRAVRNVRVTEAAARATIGLISCSNAVVRNRLSPHSSCTSALSSSRPANISLTTGSSVISISIASAMSSACARVSATHMAINSPTWRTLVVASIG